MFKLNSTGIKHIKVHFHVSLCMWSVFLLKSFWNNYFTFNCENKNINDDSRLSSCKELMKIELSVWNYFRWQNPTAWQKVIIKKKNLIWLFCSYTFSWDKCVFKSIRNVFITSIYVYIRDIVNQQSLTIYLYLSRKSIESIRPINQRR